MKPFYYTGEQISVFVYWGKRIKKTKKKTMQDQSISIMHIYMI